MKVAPFSLLSCLALLAGGCGGYGEASSSSSAPAADSGKGTRPAQESSAKTDPTAAMQEFIDALHYQDAEGFCRLTEPEVQRENFKTAGLPPGGDCVESAEILFASPGPYGTGLDWGAFAQVTIGTAELKCKSADICESAVVEVRDLPLRGGGTTSSRVHLTHSHGQWRIGPL